MKYLGKIVGLIFVLFVGSNAFSAGGLNKNTITKLAFQSDHLMIYSDGWNNPNSCQSSAGVILKKDDPNFDRAYTLILAAFMSGRQIGGYSDGCISWDEKTYNTIRGFKYLVVY